MPTVLKPKFTFGCEFEGLYHEDFRDDFFKGLREINKNICVGGDGSIEYDWPWSPCELRTPKLTLVNGLKLTESILDYLANATHAGVYRTNSTCGLHINIAEDYIFTNETFKRLFYRNIVKIFNEYKVAKSFARTNNRYCKLIKIPKKIKNNDELLESELRKERRRYDYNTPYNYKYQSVALRPLRNAVFPQRVEFRCLGNTDYQLKTKELKDAFDHIEECVTEAYTETINHIISN